MRGFREHFAISYEFLTKHAKRVDITNVTLRDLLSGKPTADYKSKDLVSCESIGAWCRQDL
jgi:hypothetical protein